MDKLNCTFQIFINKNRILNPPPRAPGQSSVAFTVNYRKKRYYSELEFKDDIPNGKWRETHRSIPTKIHKSESYHFCRFETIVNRKLSGLSRLYQNGKLIIQFYYSTNENDNLWQTIDGNDDMSHCDIILQIVQQLLKIKNTQKGFFQATYTKTGLMSKMGLNED